MSQGDIRWIQRFSNYKRAFEQLEEAVDLMNERELSQLEKQGMIQAFEYTHELAWKTLKDFLESKGIIGLFGSRDVTKEAFKLGIIEDGDAWMQMIKSRNITSHTYDESTADDIIKLVKDLYFYEFKKMRNKMVEYEENESAQS